MPAAILNKCAALGCSKQVKEYRHKYCSKQCYFESWDKGAKVGWIWVEHDITKSILDKIRFNKRSYIKNAMKKYENKPVTLIVKFDN